MPTQPPPHASGANKVLFIENLPDATNATMLAMLFQQFPGEMAAAWLAMICSLLCGARGNFTTIPHPPGYIDARMVPGKPGIAFVDFQNDIQVSESLI